MDAFGVSKSVSSAVKTQRLMLRLSRQGGKAPEYARRIAAGDIPVKSSRRNPVTNARSLLARNEVSDSVQARKARDLSEAAAWRDRASYRRGMPNPAGLPESSAGWARNYIGRARSQS